MYVQRTYGIPSADSYRKRICVCACTPLTLTDTSTCAVYQYIMFCRIYTRHLAIVVRFGIITKQEDAFFLMYPPEKREPLFFFDTTIHKNVAKNTNVIAATTVGAKCWTSFFFLFLYEASWNKGRASCSRNSQTHWHCPTGSSRGLNAHTFCFTCKQLTTMMVEAINL